MTEDFLLLIAAPLDAANMRATNQTSPNDTQAVEEVLMTAAQPTASIIAQARILEKLKTYQELSTAQATARGSNPPHNSSTVVAQHSAQRVGEALLQETLQQKQQQQAAAPSQLPAGASANSSSAEVAIGQQAEKAEQPAGRQPHSGPPAECLQQPASTGTSGAAGGGRQAGDDFERSGALRGGGFTHAEAQMGEFWRVRNILDEEQARMRLFNVLET